MLGSSMLGRKLSATGLMGAGADRGRAGERLQAALAGLQELRLLREKQGDLVDRALRMERVGPAGTAAGAPTLETEEQRLEATLTALKQQLSRLRRQDVGLKTHLQQLDQQISELKLDVNKASTEQLECDSRPSSGFYELSDGGSCSLSNSCTSVYSECLSSSQTNLLQPPQSPAVASYNVGPLEPADVCRRRSADESSAQPNPLRATGLHLGSSRIRAGAAGLERPRPRPVSTGDLDRLMPGGPGSYKSLEGNKSSACPIPRTSTMDPRFQSSLMSRSGTEVYHYPSPLHAVALQSPIFSLGEPAGAELAEGQGSPAHTLPHSDSLQRVLGTGPEPRHLSYIDRLLQRGLTLSSVQREAGQDTLQSYSDYYREISVSACPDVSQIEPTLHSSLNSNIIIPEADWARERSQEQVVHPVRNLSVKALESLHRYSYPAATREYSPSETITSATANHNIIQADHTAVVRSHSEIKMTMDVRETGVPERKRPGQRPAIPHSSSTEESQIFDVYAGHMTPSDFVHAQFVPAESQQVKVRQGDRKTKAVKLRRKSSEKPRAVKQQQHGCSPADRTRDAGRGSKAERELRRAAKAKTTPKARPCLGQERRLSGSDSSLCGPGVVYTHRIYPGPNPPPAINKPSKNHRPQWSEPEQPAEQRKKRQGPEVFQGPCVQRHRLRDPYTNAAGSRQMVHSGRPHSGQWVGPPFTLKPPVSSACFYSTLNARYPPAPFPVSSQYPPRCESEYSAECASLFHSTIAESSEGELSDDTTNHFGDSESGQSFRSRSDSDSSPYPDEGEQPDGCGGQEEGGCLVWAEAALGPTAAGLALQRLPHPEPPACRIKASRALKKKIRRFQPASLKVMTLV